MRGLSNTLAGLIILTFVLAAVLPMIIDVVNSSTQLSMRAAELAAAKARRLAPTLNVTLDANMSTLGVNVYRVENSGSDPQKLAILVVEDDNSNTYLVKARECLTGCTAGSAVITVQPVMFYSLGEDVITLLPRGLVYIEVSNGKLLGVYTAAGSYNPAKGGTVTTVEVAQYAKYAAVAGGVQTSYFDLSKYRNLADLLNSTEVALVTDPSQNETNSSILWSNMLQAECYYDGEPEVGGFTPVQQLNQTRFKGLVFFNVEPVASTFIIGGRSAGYSDPVYGAGMLLHTYTFVPFNSNLPAIIAAIDENGNWFATIIFMIDIGIGIVHTITGPLNSEVNELRNLIESHAYGYNYSNGENYVLVSNVWASNAEVWFDTGSWGLLANFTAYVEDGSYAMTIYCTPRNIDVFEHDNGTIDVKLNECVIAAVDEYGTPYIAGYNDVEQVEVHIPADGYNKTADGSYIGHYKYATVHITRAELKEQYVVGTETSGWKRPFRLKVVGYTGQGLLETFDGVRETVRNDVKAFGYYYYTGVQANNGILVFGLRNVTVSAFKFSPGATSGLEPYTAFLDTDANGLVELHFLTEDTGPGWYYTPDDEYRVLGVKMGCRDKTLNPVYLKFKGGYAVNGGSVAEVSIQIRYKFHDNAADDVDDVDDPAQFLMGFRLVDSNGIVYSTSDYIYQQLMNLEDTWPPNTQWVSDSVFLLVPDKDETYYVVFALNDPYGWDRKNNDMDFSLAIEWLGMWYLYRGQSPGSTGAGG